MGDVRTIEVNGSAQFGRVVVSCSEENGRGLHLCSPVGSCSHWASLDVPGDDGSCILSWRLDVVLVV